MFFAIATTCAVLTWTLTVRHGEWMNTCTLRIQIQHRIRQAINATISDRKGIVEFNSLEDAYYLCVLQRDLSVLSLMLLDRGPERRDQT